VNSARHQPGQLEGGSSDPARQEGHLIGQAVLDLRGLNVSFRTGSGSVKAVNGLDLTIQPGETHALVGESGSGKSATALAIMGLLPQRKAEVSGTILLNGIDLLSLKERDLRRVRGRDVAIIFQDPSSALNPVRRVGGQVAEALTAQGTARREAWRETFKLLSEVGLYDPARLARRYPFELSGGMKQRIVISAALGPRPKLLVADEPTTALDATIQEQVLKLLQRMTADGGTAMLLITHDLAVAARTAQRVSVVYGGIITETGPTEAILRQPCHPYTVGLLRAIPRLGGAHSALRGIAGEPGSAATVPHGCPFAPRCQWVLDRCWAERPQLELTTATSGGPAAHRVACWNQVLPDEAAVGRPTRAGFTPAQRAGSSQAEPRP
jgi:oligopeptide/dipeptide ABC transporter ATP-binding protein